MCNAGSNQLRCGGSVLQSNKEISPRPVPSAHRRPKRARRVVWPLLPVLALSIPLAALRTKSATHKVLPPQIIAYIFPRNAALQPSEIAAGKLTRINYAFANIQDGRIVIGSPVDEANFATLVGLKQQNPSLQVLVSVGGWIWSG